MEWGKDRRNSNSHGFGRFSAMEAPIGVNLMLTDPYLRALQLSSCTFLEIPDVLSAVPCGTRLTGSARFSGLSTDSSHCFGHISVVETRIEMNPALNRPYLRALHILSCTLLEIPDV